MNKRRTFPFFFRWFFQEISSLRVFKVTKIKIYHIICYDVRLYFSIRKTIDNQQKENFLISSIYRTQKLIALRRFMLPGSLQKKKRNQSFSTFFHWNEFTTRAKCWDKLNYDEHNLFFLLWADNKYTYTT